MKQKLGSLLREVCKKTTENNQYPVLTSSKSGIFLQEEYFTKNVASRDNTGYKIIKRGQFTYRSMSDTGYFYINCLECTDVGIVSPAYPVFEIKDGSVLDRRFLIHFFKSTTFNKIISSLSKGSTRLSLKYKDLANVEIDLPDLDKQIKIADILDDLYSFKKGVNNQLNDLDELLESKFSSLFGDFEETNFYKAKLEDLINENYIIYHLDGNHGGDYPRSNEFAESGIPYIAANCIDGDFIDMSRCKFLTKEKAATLRKGLAKDRDVLFAHNATVGPVAILRTTEELVILGTSLTAYRCNESKINIYYLLHYMKNPFFVKQYSLLMQQSTRNQIPITKQKEFFFVVPPIELQNKFGVFACDVYEAQDNLKKQLKCADELLEIKMEEYFE